DKAVINVSAGGGLLPSVMGRHRERLLAEEGADEETVGLRRQPHRQPLLELLPRAARAGALHERLDAARAELRAQVRARRPRARRRPRPPQDQAPAVRAAPPERVPGLPVA